MSAVVVDASVVAKLALPEAGSVDADGLAAERRPLIAPELVYAECANVFWKHARREGLGSQEVDGLLEDLMSLNLLSVPLRTLSPLALHLALELQHSVYDCYYLAAAIVNDCELATADKHLAELAREVGLGDRVILIGASPAR